MNNKDVATKSVNFGMILFILTLSITIILSVILYSKMIEIKQLKLIETSTVEIQTQLTFTNKTLEVCNDELTKLRNRMSGIKNVDDLLRLDIFSYIDKKFQLVPRTVAADIALQIVGQSKQTNMSPELIIGIIQVESSFNPMAISSKNARGLMQVMPEWAKKFNLKKVSDLHDIDTNIQSGIKVLKIHIEEANGNISKGLYRYVGKSDSYAGKVYEAMGEFVAFRSNIDNEKEKKNKNAIK